MKLILKNYIDNKVKLKEIENQQSELLNKLLNFIFPLGKYKGKPLKDIMKSDKKYVLYWLRENIPDNDVGVNFIRIFCSLQNIIDAIQLRKQHEQEQAYEKRCMEYCERNNMNYAIDYEIRHNPNMRDFGM